MNIDHQSAVIDFLSRPEAHGALGDAVERIETHISVVFLVGDRAYKMKRAVRFGYLDYSTLALREKFCRAELAINGETAPGLYRDVVPVTRAPDGTLALGGSARPVEWLVAMARFEQDGLFDHLAEAGRLDRDLMTSVADMIFEFHEAAPRRTRRAGAGVIGRVIGSNDVEIGKWSPAVFEPAAAAAVSERCHSALDGFASLLDRRARGGLLRRCHGDLHLRNICMFEGRPTLFDAIEFSDDLNSIDLFYDLAFLLMDLEQRGLRPLANTVLNRYLGRGGDYEGLTALPLFLACRAAIRAHTTAETAGRIDDPKAKDRLVRNARAYLALAASFFEAPAPRLTALGGPSGVGKSSLAKALAPGLGASPGAVVIRSDMIRKRLHGVGPECQLGEAAYGRDQTRRVYATLTREAKTALAAGYGVIADAVFGRADERGAIEAVARDAGAPFAGLWMHAPAEILERRILGRSGDASDADVAVLRRQLEFLPDEVEWQRLDAAGSLDDTIGAIRAALAPDPASTASAIQVG